MNVLIWFDPSFSFDPTTFEFSGFVQEQQRQHEAAGRGEDQIRQQHAALLHVPHLHRGKQNGHQKIPPESAEQHPQDEGDGAERPQLSLVCVLADSAHFPRLWVDQGAEDRKATVEHGY